MTLIGTLWDSSGNVFTGDFLRDKKHGDGRMEFVDGDGEAVLFVVCRASERVLLSYR